MLFFFAQIPYDEFPKFSLLCSDYAQKSADVWPNMPRICPHLPQNYSYIVRAPHALSSAPPATSVTVTPRSDRLLGQRRTLSRERGECESALDEHTGYQRWDGNVSRGVFFAVRRGLRCLSSNLMVLT